MSVLIDLFVKKHGKVKNLDYVVGQVCLVLYKNKHFHKIWDEKCQNPVF